ncbi:hypothetical protein [Nitrococcus mobilis]|uniref:Uncharacterized protein n=1 Tax=Nitrococcus mobilis Nb-231 TaxID=314278 RepID=A4BU70_9GAMM|nr:hypothetical protein [Nitrococcus mobilis]EAR20744.1 hypothetical protein NB231_12676 [Nitrococcus mobilis Nb-231]
MDDELAIETLGGFASGATLPRTVPASPAPVSSSPISKSSDVVLYVGVSKSGQANEDFQPARSQKTHYILCWRCAHVFCKRGDANPA